MAEIVVVANQKGGVGKSTTVVNVAASLATMGKKVLAVDFDPQGNTTSGLGIIKDDVAHTVYDLLLSKENLLKEVCLPTEIENLSVIPSNLDLSGIHLELENVHNKYYLLKNKLTPIKEEYDYIFIDTPPSLGFLTLSGLSSADAVLIPLQSEFYALEGISQLLKTIKIVREKLNKNLSIMGVVVTMFDVRTNLSTQVLEEVTKFFKDKVYKTIIPRNVKLSEAPSFGKPVLLYQPHSVGASSYIELAKEIIKNG